MAKIVCYLGGGSGKLRRFDRFDGLDALLIQYGNGL